MSGSAGGTKSAIVVAIIGVIGIVLGSLIDGYMQRPRTQPTEQAVDQQSVAAHQGEGSAPAHVRLTAARIGKVGPSGQVQGHTTRFKAEEEVAITLEVDAEPSVARFPVRVTASLFGGPFMYQDNDFADVSAPGLQRLTFRFSANEHRFDPLFLSVAIEGQKVYGQEISIDHE